MKTFSIILFTIVLQVLALSPSQAQQVEAKINQLGFMSGRWVLQHKWGEMEEYWSSPAGDNMMCSFRCVKDGKAVFYEFIVMEQSSKTVTMKMRHFNWGNIAWEEKDKPYILNLVSLTKNKALFQSADKKVKLGYERTAPAKMISWLEEKNAKGNIERENFDYTLKP